MSDGSDQLKPLDTMFSEVAGHRFSDTYNHITEGGEKVGRSVSEVTSSSERSERSGMSGRSDVSYKSSMASYKSSVASDSIAGGSTPGDSIERGESSEGSGCSVVASVQSVQSVQSEIHSVRALELLDSADRIGNSARGMGLKRSIERKVRPLLLK